MKELRGKGSGILAGEAILVISRDKVGDTLAIQFSEPSGTRNQWRLVVRVNTSEGDYNLGSFVTRPPYGTGDPAARVVALASQPGVKGWRVMCYGPRGAVARLSLSTRKLATGLGNAAIVPVNGSQVISNRWSPSPNIGVKLLQGVATDGPGTVLEGYGYRDPAAAGLVFFGFVDKASAIVNGDLFTIAPLPVPAAVAGIPQILAWNFGDGVADGLRFVNQARWVVSGTDQFVTIAAAGQEMRVQNKVV